MRLFVTKEECLEFPGSWSLWPAQMYRALNAVEYIDKIKILEFGAGDGTKALAEILNNKGIDYRYFTYENDQRYIIDTDKITTMIWNDFPDRIIDGIFDLIIIDGPEGVSRSKWYPLIKKNARPGTIIVIDDFGHYQEFSDALNANFNYDIIDQRDRFARTGTTWLTVRT